MLGAVIAAAAGGIAATAPFMAAAALVGGVAGGGVLWVFTARLGGDAMRLAVVVYSESRPQDVVDAALLRDVYGVRGRVWQDDLGGLVCTFDGVSEVD